jgi:hypothetical protein
MTHSIIWIVNFLFVFGCLIPNAVAEPTAHTAPPTLAYTYPFSDGMMAQNLRTKPVMVELFTSLDCLFCPVAEQLIDDLAQKTPALVLACHTDPEGASYPLAREFCAARQERYGASLSDGLTYTPQMVINGHIDAVGHEFEDVRLGLTESFADDMNAIMIRASDQPQLLTVTTPAINIPKGQTADIFAVTYRPPVTVPATMRQSTTRPHALAHVASRFMPLGGYAGSAKTLTVPFATSDDTAGIIIFIQRSDNTIIAAGEWPTRTP